MVPGNCSERLPEERDLPAAVSHLGFGQQGALDARCALEVAFELPSARFGQALEADSHQWIGGQSIGRDRRTADRTDPPGSALDGAQRRIDAAHQFHQALLLAVFRQLGKLGPSGQQAVPRTHRTRGHGCLPSSSALRSRTICPA